MKVYSMYIERRRVSGGTGHITLRQHGESDFPLPKSWYGWPVTTDGVTRTRTLQCILPADQSPTGEAIILLHGTNAGPFASEKTPDICLLSEAMNSIRKGWGDWKVEIRQEVTA